jgi:DNA-binding beta-propeller fold protein YncE
VPRGTPLTPSPPPFRPPAPLGRRPPPPPAAAAAAARRFAHVFGRELFDVPTDGEPTCVAVSADGQVFVAQLGTNTIGVFAADDGRRLRTLGEGEGAGERELFRPADVALSADDGTVFIADCYNDRVAVWRPDGALRRITGGSAPLWHPCGLALSPDGTELFVVETNNHRVSVFEPRNRRLLRSWGRRGSGAGEFNWPTYCALSCDGRVLFVADTDNHRVVACDATSGGMLWCCGRKGSGDGELSYPHGLALSRCGRELFVADRRNNRVVVLSVDDGSAVRSWAVAGGPMGVGLGPDGHLFVVSYGSSRLRKFL